MRSVTPRLGLLLASVVVSVGCASASKSPARSAESPPAASEPSSQLAGRAPGASEATQDSYASPPPAPAQPAGGGSGGGSRSMALQSATRELEVSQRELEVSAGDCRNACRALGSMDRAAGKVCELSATDAEGHRCDDAKRHVYGARDRVKATCGACPGGPSVDRAAPIPSLR